ncbi:hypothetical protein [Flavobacterium capsici]|uniref:Gliding motility-associated protein GldM C-terminal domain-containing protein n=1 Tax=Flavobacterium capsici TaxID=3075618 RepID=A0AA96EYV0_9FLAO|nr:MULTISPECIES: hypothetical protein [unclassified Flavobacterium]WNM19273.1 hypothetical protein RN608_00990 [Flavobacterium sp. PMR2A8]WNM20662.1 hypothetical protein RN605_08160 [Flavobacterium sp. PMTSA4]
MNPLQNYNKKTFFIILNFLAIMTNSLSAQLVSSLSKEPGKVKLDDQTLYIRKQIEGGNQADLLDGTTERVTGICNFDKNRLQPGRAVVFDSVAFEYAEGTADGEEGALAYDDVPPAVLQNCDFIIKQNGLVVFEAPVRDICNIDTGQNSKDAYTSTNSLRLLNDVDTIDMYIKFPPGVSLDPAKFHYVLIRLKGCQTQVKS